MLTNPQRSQDGFAKVFSKGDIEKLKGHGCIEKTKEAETMLAKALGNIPTDGGHQ